MRMKGRRILRFPIATMLIKSLKIVKGLLLTWNLRIVTLRLKCIRSCISYELCCFHYCRNSTSIWLGLIKLRKASMTHWWTKLKNRLENWMPISTNIQRFFMGSSISWILLSHARFLWPVNLCFRKNLENRSIRCLTNTRKYRIGNSLSKCMVNLIYARNNIYHQSLRKMGNYRPMVRRMVWRYLRKLWKCPTI